MSQTLQKRDSMTEQLDGMLERYMALRAEFQSEDCFDSRRSLLNDRVDLFNEMVGLCDRLSEMTGNFILDDGWLAWFLEGPSALGNLCGEHGLSRTVQTLRYR